MRIKNTQITKILFSLAFILFFNININLLFAGGPIEIYDWEDLHNIRNDLSGHYVLMNDLDENSNGYLDYASPTANSDTGWQPIGNTSGSFTGTFNGNGYNIHDFYINNTVNGSGEYLGLFGLIGNNSVVRNLNLHGEVSLYRWSGCLVGVQNGSNSIIEYVNVNCNVSGLHSRAGGLVGWQVEGLIQKASFEGSVSGNDYVGGIIGQQATGGIARNVFSTGTINSTSSHVGGIIGYQSGILEDSYSSANVAATQGSVGGVTGNLQPSGQIYRSYAVGVITGAGWASSRGGVVGNASGNVIDSAYNTETTTRDRACGTGLGDCSTSGGFTTQQMRDISTYNDLNWDIQLNTQDDLASGYPYLSWQIQNDDILWQIYISVSETPSNLSPVDLSNNVILNPQLVASDFINLDGNNHTETIWQVDDNLDFSSPVWTRESNNPETTIVINDDNGSFDNELIGQTELDYQTTYYWRVRYRDDGSNYCSDWSEPTSFTTLNEYTLFFDTDGGTTIDPITQYYGTTITKPTDPTKPGYIFVEWIPEIPETMPDENTTYVALFEPVSAPRRSGGGGTSAQARVSNLERAGNLEAADRLREQFNLPIEHQQIDTEETPTHTTQQQITLPQIVELLISLGFITPDKAEQARQAVQSFSAPQNSRIDFAHDLELNSEGEDVRRLQEFLNNNGFTVSVIGAGSPGNETDFFGPATQSALARYQAANNIKPSIGIFGPITRSFINNNI